jgi:prefoldin subunit 5
MAFLGNAAVKMSYPTKYDLLKRKIENLEYSSKEFEKTIQALSKDLTLRITQKINLKEIINDCVNAEVSMRTTAKVVSLDEYKKIKNEIVVSVGSLGEVEVSILRITEYIQNNSQKLKETNDDLEKSKKELQDFGGIVKI